MRRAIAILILLPALAYAQGMAAHHKAAAALRSGGGGPLWTPADITTAVWLDAATAAYVLNDSGTPATNGQKVATWIDRSGNARNVSSAVDGTRPKLQTSAQNGLQALLWDGAYYLSGNAAFYSTVRNVSNAHVFVACKATTTTGRRELVRWDNNSYGIARLLISAGISVAKRYQIGGRRLDADSYDSVDSSTDHGTSWTTIAASFRYGAATATLREDGTQTALDSAYQTAGNVPDTASYGAGVGATPTSGANNWVGNIGEIVVVTAAMSDAEVQRMEGYLAWRWGAQGALPVGHAYKSAAPTK